MGRALQEGDYVVLTERGVIIMGRQYRDTLFVLDEVGYNWDSGFGEVDTRKSYFLKEVLEDGTLHDFGNMYRSEIKLFRPKKSDIPKPRMTFGQWMKEMENARV